MYISTLTFHFDAVLRRNTILPDWTLDCTVFSNYTVLYIVEGGELCDSLGQIQWAWKELKCELGSEWRIKSPKLIESIMWPPASDWPGWRTREGRNYRWPTVWWTRNFYLTNRARKRKNALLISYSSRMLFSNDDESRFFSFIKHLFLPTEMILKTFEFTSD